MQTATCVLCQERINLLAQKLVTVQWVDSKSGALLSLTFHSDCYVRWYRETARSQQRESAQTETPKRETPLTTAPPKVRPLLPNADSPEKHLSPDELKRLARLRGKSDADASGVIRASDGARREVDAEDHLDQPDQPHKDAPQEDQPEDGHDVAPPHV